MAVIPVAVLAAVMISLQVRGQQQEAPVATEVSAAPESTAAEAAAEPPIVIAQADTGATRRFELGEHYERLTPA